MFFLVGEVGLEPTHLTAPELKSDAATNYAIPPSFYTGIFRASRHLRRQSRKSGYNNRQHSRMAFLP